jgi:hypothetical protein
VIRAHILAAYFANPVAFKAVFRVIAIGGGTTVWVPDAADGAGRAS